MFDIAVTAGFSVAAAEADSVYLFLTYAGVMLVFLACTWREK